jgi:hypothetical protein
MVSPDALQQHRLPLADVLGVAPVEVGVTH